MTRLLVSVRDAGEVAAALRGGADLIDVKEPRAGALGAASAETCRAVLQAVAGRVPVSVALGELTDSSAAELIAGPRYAKLGLAGARGLRDWRDAWRQRLRAFPAGTGVVAVIYADWQRAAAPTPDEVLAAALSSHCQALLVDTFDKSSGDLFAHLAVDQLRRLIAVARREDLLVVLAGSLRGASLVQAVQLGPDLVAVRGAVARPGRDGCVQAGLVADVAQMIRKQAPTPASAVL